MVKVTNIYEDGSPKVFTSPKQEDTYLYITGAADDVINGVVGEGKSFVLTNEDGTNTVVVEGKFIDNVYLKDGYITWQNAVIGDRLSLELVLPANIPLASTTNTGNAVYDENGVITYITSSSTPDDTWIGTHMYFPIEVVVNRFVNKVHMLGDNTVGMVIESSDAALIPKELAVRFKLVTPSGNTAIVASIAMELYRTRTV